MFSTLILATAALFTLQKQEAGKYWKAVTGGDMPANAIAFAIDAKVSASGKDAYTIKSTAQGVQLTGSNERSTWYALYDLLERRAGCRWFWDADIVPRQPTIDLTGLDVKEEAQFEYRGLRYFAHRGLTRFQAEHWGLADWQKEIDWMLKKRLNTFMLRIGQDDLFQRTFPDVCAHPDPAKALPGHGKGYDNRSLFWSLDYRGRLRTAVQGYGRARGMMIPEDFGTMTHWYSRTPQDYLEKKNPPFLPQATKGYSEQNGLVWDIRDPQWADEYWKLTKVAVDAYGGGKAELLHTIGLGERRCYTNRADNLALKLKALDTFISRAHRDYPEAKVLLAGWDFYFTWRPEEVQELVKRLDPNRVIIWDYEGDATTDYRKEMQGVRNNFTKWGVMGKFPYTYSVFLAYESALDARANYPLIEERQRLVQNDPMCKGYILWPEASHTDTLALEHFAANAWKRGGESIAAVLPRFCRDRYGRESGKMQAIWEQALPLSRLLDWGGNYANFVMARRTRFRNVSSGEGFKAAETAAPALLNALAEVTTDDERLRRDVIDLARMVTDRAIISVNNDALVGYEAWRKGKDTSDGAACVRAAQKLARLCALMAKLLAQHTDYSLWESFSRLDAIEKVKNPDFPQVLLENASCGYCRSHQYECAEHWYRPAAEQLAVEIAGNVAAGRKVPLAREDPARLTALLATPLETMRPRDVRDAAYLRNVLREIAEAL